MPNMTELSQWQPAVPYGSLVYALVRVCVWPQV